MGAPERLALGTKATSPPSNLITVLRKLISCTIPITPPAEILSPNTKGFSNKITKVLKKFLAVSCAAKARAKEPMPREAITAPKLNPHASAKEIAPITKITILKMRPQTTTIASVGSSPNFLAIIFTKKPSLFTYIAWIILTFAIPIIPMIGAAFLGFIFAKISTFFKKKNIIQTILTFVFVLFCFSLQYIIEAFAKKDNAKQLIEEAAGSIEGLGKIYWPVKWFSDAVREPSLLNFVCLILVSFVIFEIVFLIVGKNYRQINSALKTHSASKDYTMTRQKKHSIVNSIAFKEFKRMTGSQTYLINGSMGVVLALVQGFFIVQLLSNEYGVVDNPGFLSYAYIAVVYTAGTMFLLWLADQITTKGIGNGVSVIIFAGIVADMPTNFQAVYQTFVGEYATSSLGWLGFIIYCLMFVAIIVLVVVMQLSERRIPIQGSSGYRTNKTKGDLNHLPLKINSASVIPVIFAGALIQGPQIIASWVNNDAYEWLQKVCDFSSPWFLCFYAVLIILFTFFYTNLTIDPQKMADDLGKNGQYIPGVRPGSETKNYVSKVLNRITVLGAILLTFIAILPYVISTVVGLPQSAAIGGTGIIIVVGIAMDTVKQMKSMLTSKQYKSFVGK